MEGNEFVSNPPPVPNTENTHSMTDDLLGLTSLATAVTAVVNNNPSTLISKGKNEIAKRNKLLKQN